MLPAPLAAQIQTRPLVLLSSENTMVAQEAANQATSVDSAAVEAANPFQPSAASFSLKVEESALRPPLSQHFATAPHSLAAVVVAVAVAVASLWRLPTVVGTTRTRGLKNQRRGMAAPGAAGRNGRLTQNERKNSCRRVTAAVAMMLGSMAVVVALAAAGVAVMAVMAVAVLVGLSGRQMLLVCPLARCSEAGVGAAEAAEASEELVEEGVDRLTGTRALSEASTAHFQALGPQQVPPPHTH
jgi:hypothetical protein